MRRLINITFGFAAMILAAVSCTKDNELPLQAVETALVGEWHLQEAHTEGIAIDENLDIYLAINSDGIFELYQKSGSQSIRYDRYYGRCWSEDGIITGKYSDGKPWGGKYEYTVNGDELILRSYNLLEVQKYVRVQIPDEIRTNANTITKAAVSGSPIL